MRRRLADERGQVLPLLATGLAVVLLGIAALVVDVGRAYLAQRQLQAGSDAAALAGAGALPDAAAAAATATSYSDANTSSAADSVTTDPPDVRCLHSTPDCSADQPNAISVTQTGTVSTTFGRILGIDTITVKAEATAARSGGTKPLDVAIVVDRTGSMSNTIGTLKTAVDHFIGLLDDRYVQISLLVLPPVQCSWRNCSTDNYPAGANYVLAPLGTPFGDVTRLVDGFIAQGYTSYKPALAAAVAQLEAGDPDAQKAIVFETDGAANSVPDEDYSDPTWNGSYMIGWAANAASEQDIEHPCGSAVDYVAGQGIPVYTVGYALAKDENCYQAPHYERTRRGWTTTITSHDVLEGISAEDALKQMATLTKGNYYASGEADLSDVLAKVATDLSSPKLVPNGS